MKRKTKRKLAQNQRRAEENRRQQETSDTRVEFHNLLQTYGGVGIIQFAVEQQQAACLDLYAPSKESVQTWETTKFHAFIEDVFKKGSQLADRVLGFFHLIESYGDLCTTQNRVTLKRIIEAAPPILSTFYKLYAPKGLRGAVFATRNSLANRPVSLFKFEEYRMTLGSNFITWNIKIVLGEDASRYNFLDPKRIECRFINEWGQPDWAGIVKTLCDLLPKESIACPFPIADRSMAVKSALTQAFLSAVASVDRRIKRSEKIRRRQRAIEKEAINIKKRVIKVTEADSTNRALMARNRDKLSRAAERAERIRDYYIEQFPSDCV